MVKLDAWLEAVVAVVLVKLQETDGLVMLEVAVTTRLEAAILAWLEAGEPSWLEAAVPAWLESVVLAELVKLEPDRLAFLAFLTGQEDKCLANPLRFLHTFWQKPQGTC